MKKIFWVLVVIAVLFVAGWVAYRAGWVTGLAKTPRPSEARTPVIPGVQQPEAGTSVVPGSLLPEVLPQNMDLAALDAEISHVRVFRIYNFLTFEGQPQSRSRHDTGV